ncbi:uncharacterized membrane protein At4g09580 [Cucumis sativus]|uniref:VTT domain-containing protein n=1 Tax=Cucumis sativus TaxID=3659 RepID=A0A0A0LSW5_CUCSA|nr:uncharacterized membrane protein At4g09580 [Cucumis sativus]KGN63106.1 hypothetical protein Csa_022074 [Cucumis sativus]
MAAPRNLVLRDEEKAEMNNPAAKKMKSERYPFSRWGLTVALGSFLVYSAALFCIYRTMPAADFKYIKLPRSLADLRMLKDHLGSYAKDHTGRFILGYCSTYIFMQTFMIPGTVFLSLLGGALFGVVRGLVLVVFNATAGATACFFLSNLIGRPFVSWMWPEKLKTFQSEIAKQREKLLNYMIFLRITPTLPNIFINLASPIVDIPFHVFLLATLIGLVPSSYIMVRAGLALGDLKSVKDLYDFKTLTLLFFIGSLSILPTLLKRKQTYE